MKISQILKQAGNLRELLGLKLDKPDSFYFAYPVIPDRYEIIVNGCQCPTNRYPRCDRRCEFCECLTEDEMEIYYTFGHRRLIEYYLDQFNEFRGL